MIYYGLLLFFVFEYVRPTSYIPFLYVLHLNSIIPTAIIILSFFSKQGISNSEALKTTSSRWIMFFLFLLAISVMTADVTLYAFNIFKAVLQTFLIHLVIVKEINELKKMKGILSILVFVHVAVAALSPDVILHPEERNYIAAGAFLGDGNDFALSTVIVVPFCLFLLMDAKKTSAKVIYAITLALLVLCIIGTSSRGGSLALAAVCFYLWMKSKKKVWGAVGIVFLLFIAMLYAPPNYFQRMNSITQYQTEGSAQGRIMAWKASIRMAKDSPLIGIGAGHFGVKYGAEYRSQEAELMGVPWQTAHSIYFLVIGELGIPGIVFLVCILLTNFRSNEKELRLINQKSYQKEDSQYHLLLCLNAGLIGFIVGGAFLSALYYPHLYIITALLESRRKFHGERDLIDKSLSTDNVSVAANKQLKYELR